MRRKGTILAVGLLTATVAALIVLVLNVRSAMTPLIHVSAKADETNPGDPQVRRTLQGRYAKLADAMMAADLTALANVTTPDFVMERIFRDNVYNYRLKDWQAALTRYGGLQPPWPMTANTSGVRFRQQQRCEVTIESVAVKGDQATVVATMSFHSGGSRDPPGIAFTGIQTIHERDSWVKAGPEWRLRHSRMLSLKWTRESTRQGATD